MDEALVGVANTIPVTESRSAKEGVVIGKETGELNGLRELAKAVGDAKKFSQMLEDFPPGVQYAVVREIAQSDRFTYPDGRLDTDFGVYPNPYTVNFSGSARYENSPPHIRAAYNKVKDGITIQGQYLNSAPDGHYQGLPIGYTKEMIKAQFGSRTKDEPLQVDPFLFVALNLRKIQAVSGLTLTGDREIDPEKLILMTNKQIAAALEGMAARKNFKFTSGPSVLEILENQFDVRASAHWVRNTGRNLNDVNKVGDSRT